ncbi:HAMP domain-containing sensor histidine kinase [Sporosarcina thermotolerans]|uniref:histidine kinase n=1 Tax=Sporosarcina thermotolerans TaxID=633404 RepID=A0AAW9AF96_9BACL|nr:HAMP domain-containing sensor histidine kinase [Sporosarcina thermotolerans]MDW0118318.1 HAMP domain-containing sensor histidine kinase [Sporosarcina thermotolerans]
MKLTIRKKFFIGFFIVFFIAAVLSNQTMAKMLEKNTMTNLEETVASLQYSSTQFIKQFGQLHPESGNFVVEHSDKLANELSKLNGQSVALYNREGQFLYEAVPINRPLLMEQQQFQENVGESSSEELKRAFQNQSAYTIQQLREGGTLLYFAYPVYLNNTLYGVVRFTADYTDVFLHNKILLRTFTVMTILLFVGVYLMSLLLSNQFIRRVKEVTTATKRMTTGDYEPIAANKATDEIGELAHNFQQMQLQIQQHIQTIEQEKEKVLLLEEKRTAFLHNVTHELKTPLATISGYAQIIGEREFDDLEFLQRASKKIRNESERLNEMVTQLLALSKYQSLMSNSSHEMIDVCPIMQSVCEDLLVLADPRHMKIHLKGRPYIMQGNPDEIRQLFMNVVNNAILHGTPGGSVEIIVDEKITVTNPCAPIPPAIADNIFEPFVHSKMEGSSGLGLFICADIIARHHGMIQFQERNGHARISIKLPRQKHVGNM